MLWLGVRCWKDKIALAAIEDAEPPLLVVDRREGTPRGEKDVGRLAWWAQQLAEEMLDESKAQGLALFVSSGEVEQTRAALEGATAAAAGHHAIPTMLINRKNVWKPLGIANAKTESWNNFLKADTLIGGLVGDLKEAAAASIAAARRESA